MNEDDKKEDAVGSSHVSNNDSTNERVTRKGRRLARQGQAAASSASATRPGAKSSNTNDNDVRATMQNTTFFQHRVVNQPGRPEGSGYWQLTERNARQERLERHRREAAASLLSASEMTNGAQNETATDSPNPNLAVVTGELVDSLPEESNGEKKKRRRRLSCAILLFVFLAVAVALPLALMERSEGDPDRLEDDPNSVPTGPPVLPRTFAPSVTPGASSFVKFGNDIEGEDRLGRFGFSVAFVGERWVAVGVPFSYTEPGLGFVRVFDIYNRSQIGQDLVSNIEEFSNRFGEYLSGTKDFLAVAFSTFVDLFRYNETSRQWDRVGPTLEPPRSFTDPRLRLAFLQITALSIDQLSMSANMTLIRLTVTLWAPDPLHDFVVFTLFTMDVSQPTPVWSPTGNAIVVEDAKLGTAAGFVGDNALFVGVAGQSVAATRAFLLQRDVWVEQTNFTLPQSVSSTSRWLTTSFFHTTNSTVVAFAYQSNSSGTPPTITVVDVGPDLSVTQKGSPIRYLGNFTTGWRLTKVVVHGEWLVGGWSRLGEFVGVVYRLKGGDWVKQGNDLRVSVVGVIDRLVVALSASSLYENVESPTVVAGFIFGRDQMGFARLFRARGELS